MVGESRHRVAAICGHYVDEALALTDLSAVREVAADETSRARGHDYISLTAKPGNGACWRWRRAARSKR